MVTNKIPETIMKELKIIKSIFCQTSIFFTLIVVFFYLIVSSLMEEPILQIFGMFLFLLFSFILALCNQLFRIKKIPAVLRLLIHFVIIISVVITAFFTLSSDTASIGGALIIVFALAIIYAICGAVAFIITSKLKREKSKKDDYKPQFAAITEKNSKRK